MKRLSRNLVSFAALMALPGLCMVDAGFAEQVGGTEASPPADAGAPAGETAAQAEARKRAAPANFLPIVRGRLPMLFVHAVRFDAVLAKMSNKDLATKLATSVGKVFDIRKNRNFAYITANYKPSAADVQAAEAWIAQVGGTNAKGVSATGDKTLMTQLVEQYKAAGLGTEAEAAALIAANKPAPTPKAPGAPAAPAPQSTGEVAELAAANVGSATADDLLA